MSERPALLKPPNKKLTGINKKVIDILRKMLLFALWNCKRIYPFYPRLI